MTEFGKITYRNLSMLTAEECPGCVQLMGLFVLFHTSVLGTKGQLVDGRNKAREEQTWRCLYLGPVVVSGGEQWDRYPHFLDLVFLVMLAR